MITRFDSLNRFELPRFTLCNPGSVYQNGKLSKVIGILIDTSDEENVFNFNAVSELNFRVERVKRQDPEENEYAYNLYRQIQNRRLIFVENIGYFVVTECSETVEINQIYKDVKAQSIEIELQKIEVPYIQGTYRFLSDETTNKGLFNTLVEKFPYWTVGHVDETVAERWRSFDEVDTTLNCYGFMLENMQDAYECIFIFDIMNRQINVYDQGNYVRKTSIHLTKNDLINSLNVTENANELYTALRATGSNNVNIAAINPLGGNVIYNFNYYLDWMQPELRAKVVTWQNDVENKRTDYHDKNLEYYRNLGTMSDYKSELSRLEIQLTMYRRMRENIVAESDTSTVGAYNSVIVSNGGTAVEIGENIEETLAVVDDLIAVAENAYDVKNQEIEALQIVIDTQKGEIEAIHQLLSLSTRFTQTELDELSQYIYEGSYSDDYVVITDSMNYSEQFAQMEILYDRAKTQLERTAKPTQEFDIDVENFIFDKEFKDKTDQLETGCLINVELDQDDIAYLFLCTITINYYDHSLSLTFGNRFNKFDPKTLFNGLLGNISKANNSLNYLKEQIYPIKSGEFNAMQEAIQTSRDLTMGQALSSENEQVLIDGSGYTGRKVLPGGDIDPHQVKITGKNIVFTDDAWQSSKVAIGEILLGDDASTYGINAQTIIGDLIMGNNLKIFDNEGNELLSVIDSKISSSVSGLVSATTLEQTNNSISLRIDELAGNDTFVTSAGYRFDGDGLQIYRSGDEIKNLINNTGMFVKRISGNTEENVLVADTNGVNALNLTSRQYLIVGDHARFENFRTETDNKRTACFFI